MRGGRAWLLLALLAPAAAAGPDGAYDEGPRVGNSVHATHCSTWYGLLTEARMKCDSDSGCAVLHDFDCDGANWRHCAEPVGALAAASTDSSACTLVKEGAGSWQPPASPYIAGPRVGNAAHAAHCSAWHGGRAQAEEYCDTDPGCAVLHDFNCDGAAWRYCTAGIQELLQASADTSACTLVTTYGTTTSPEPAAYVGGPRVANSAHSALCSTWYGNYTEAGERCSASPECSVLHDFQCDGANWRFCTHPIEVIQAAGADTLACTALNRTFATVTSQVTTTSAPGYVEGPRAGNAAHASHCSSWHGGEAEARSKCDDDPDCLALHDFNCDGAAWRYCNHGIGVILAASADTSACTLVRSIPEAPTSATTTPGVPGYVGGPRVGDAAGSALCSSWFGAREEAEGRCGEEPGCSVLHDFACDGANWRYCSHPIEAIQAASRDSRACTLLGQGSANHSGTTTGMAPGTTAGGRVYVDGPRLGNSVHSGHCSSWHGSRAEAESKCSDDSGCAALHDFGCDGAAWRVCMGTVEALQAASRDTAACTLVPALA